MRLALLIAAVMGATAPSVRAACSGAPDSCVDEFTCYFVLPSPNTPAFGGVSGVSLNDQFENATVNVTRTKYLCTPSDTNGTGTIDPATHLEAYKIKQTTPHLTRSPVRVTYQFEQIRVEVHKPDLLFVPTNKTLVQPGPPPPDEMAINVDHYKCYRVSIADKTPVNQTNHKASVADQFSVGRLLTLRKPRHLCMPADKNGEGIKNPNVSLICLSARPARNEPKHLPREGLFVDNQFGPERLNTIKEKEFCLPASTSLSPSGAFLDGGPFD